MNVDLLHVPACPNVAIARERILDAARRTGVPVDLQVCEVADRTAAVAAAMRGSPTVLVGGFDVVPDDTTASVSCRLYLGSGGAPSVEAIAGALQRAG